MDEGVSNVDAVHPGLRRSLEMEGNEIRGT